MKNEEGIATPTLDRADRRDRADTRDRGDTRADRSDRSDRSDRPDTRVGQHLRETAEQAGEMASSAIGGLKNTLEDIGYKMGNGRDTIIAKTKKNWRATDAYVGKNPWWAVGISAGVAFLAGMFIARRRD